MEHSRGLFAHVLRINIITLAACLRSPRKVYIGYLHPIATNVTVGDLGGRILRLLVYLLATYMYLKVERPKSPRRCFLFC